MAESHPGVDTSLDAPPERPVLPFADVAPRLAAIVMDDEAWAVAGARGLSIDRARWDESGPAGDAPDVALEAFDPDHDRGDTHLMPVIRLRPAPDVSANTFAVWVGSSRFSR